MRLPRDNPREFLSRISPFIERDGGRNMLDVSSQLNIPYETIRRRFQDLRSKGISIIPMISPESLGLKRFRVFFSLPDDTIHLKALFGSMNQFAGLTYYGRDITTQSFESEFWTPNNMDQEFQKILRGMEEMKLIEGLSLREIVWKDILKMKTHLFDYESGEWNVDFQRLVGDPSLDVPKTDHGIGQTVSSLSGKVDHIDLLIIKSLQINLSVHIVELADQIKVTDRDIAYHLNRHVLGRKQVSGFRFKWIGSKDAWSKHTITPISLHFRDIDSTDQAHAMSILTALPFTWVHFLTADNGYASELLIPVSSLNETMQYLSSMFRKYQLSPRFSFVDWSCTSTYTIPYQLHDAEAGWQLNAESGLGQILGVIAEHNSDRTRKQHQAS